MAIIQLIISFLLAFSQILAPINTVISAGGEDAFFTEWSQDKQFTEEDYEILVKNPEKAPSEPVKNVSMKDSLVTCLKSRHVWLGGLTLMFVLVPQVIISSFLPQALQLEKGMTGVTAGYITSAYMLGMVVRKRIKTRNILKL